MTAESGKSFTVPCPNHPTEACPQDCLTYLSNSLAIERIADQSGVSPNEVSERVMHPTGRNANTRGLY